MGSLGLLSGLPHDSAKLAGLLGAKRRAGLYDAPPFYVRYSMYANVTPEPVGQITRGGVS
jgi:hypothetical protein